MNSKRYTLVLFWCPECRENDVTKERISKMLKAGANVILTTRGIDDMALKVTPRTFVG